MRKVFIPAFLFLVMGCEPKAVVRDSAVYQTELQFMSQAALQQADLLQGFVKTNCACDAAKHFTTENCQKAAKTALVVKTRVPWHEQMMLYNAGLTSTRPATTPPAVPDVSTLCP